MARMPGTIWQGEHGGSLMTRHDIVCVHTIVGYAPAHAAHFSVRGDGTILQSRDTRYKSAANLNGNHRVIAIENEDHGPHFPKWGGSDVPALTPAQVSANARILRWAHETHGVPLQLCPNSRPTSRGLAYHRQGCDGNFTSYPGRVSGGEVWSKAYGKVCPGDRRIAQLSAILSAASGGTPSIDPQEDDPLAAFTQEELIAIAASGTNRAHYESGTRTDIRLNEVAKVAAELAAEATVARLIAELDDPTSALSEKLIAYAASGSNRAHYDDPAKPKTRTSERLDRVVDDVATRLAASNES